jgi:hypothetical protein
MQGGNGAAPWIWSLGAATQWQQKPCFRVRCKDHVGTIYSGLHDYCNVMPSSINTKFSMKVFVLIFLRSDMNRGQLIQ